MDDCEIDGEEAVRESEGLLAYIESDLAHPHLAEKVRSEKGEGLKDFLMMTASVLGTNECTSSGSGSKTSSIAAFLEDLETERAEESDTTTGADANQSHHKKSSPPSPKKVEGTDSMIEVTTGITSFFTGDIQKVLKNKEKSNNQTNKQLHNYKKTIIKNYLFFFIMRYASGAAKNIEEKEPLMTPTIIEKANLPKSPVPNRYIANTTRNTESEVPSDLRIVCRKLSSKIVP